MVRKPQTRQLRFLRASAKALRLHDLLEREEEASRHLVDWLNEPARTPAHENIEGLIRNIREVRELLQPASFPEWVKREMSAESASASIWEKIHRINEQLNGYKMWPRYTTFRTTFTGQTKHGEKNQESPRDAVVATGRIRSQSGSPSAETGRAKRSSSIASMSKLRAMAFCLKGLEHVLLSTLPGPI